jgi:molecular chaperone GrpE
MSERSPRPARGRQGNGDERRAHRTRAEERIGELAATPNGLMAQLDELREQLSKAESEAEENRAGWQRTAADFSNFRRRTEQDRQASLGLASEALLIKVLNLADDFDRAIGQIPAELEANSWVDGIVAIDRKLRALLDSEGLTPIEAQGASFDPHLHEAVVQQETTAVPEGTITAELKRGYRLRDRVLRPALVAVAKAPASEHGQDHSTANPDTHQPAPGADLTED